MTPSITNIDYSFTQIMMFIWHWGTLALTAIVCVLAEVKLHLANKHKQVGKPDRQVGKPVRYGLMLLCLSGAFGTVGIYLQSSFTAELSYTFVMLGTALLLYFSRRWILE